MTQQTQVEETGPEDHAASAPGHAAEAETAQLMDQAAKVAARGLMAHPHVESAIVEITGSHHEPVFHLQCTVKQAEDPTEVMETVSTGVIPNLEKILNTSFVSRDLNFALTPEHFTSPTHGRTGSQEIS